MLPELEDPAAIYDGVSCTIKHEGLPLERNPSKRFATAKSELGFLELATTRGVFFTNRLHSLRRNAEKFAGAARRILQIFFGGPFLVMSQRMNLSCVAVIPNDVRGARHMTQITTIARRIFDAILHRLDEWFWRIRWFNLRLAPHDDELSVPILLRQVSVERYSFGLDDTVAPRSTNNHFYIPNLKAGAFQ